MPRHIAALKKVNAELRKEAKRLKKTPRSRRAVGPIGPCAGQGTAARPGLAPRDQARRHPRPGAARRQERAALHPQQQRFHQAFSPGRGGDRCAAGALRGVSPRF
jgi:hypothetical protein